MTTIRLFVAVPRAGIVQVQMASTHEGVSGRLLVIDDSLRRSIVNLMDSLRQVLEVAGIRLNKLDVQGDTANTESDATQGQVQTPLPPGRRRVNRVLSGNGVELDLDGLVDLVA